LFPFILLVVIAFHTLTVLMLCLTDQTMLASVVALS